MGMLAHLQPGYSPLVVMLLPPRVEVCLDTNNTLCSANSDGTVVQAQFCSYHSQMQIDGTNVAYVVQPWTPYTGCDEPKLPALSPNPTPADLANDAGSRLVSPLSAGQISAIVNPALNGWVANSGDEINDNDGCQPFGAPLDTVPVGSGSYVIQREYNNAAAIEDDPNTYFGCAPNVLLSPSFVVPSAVDPGDTVVFDGSDTASTLLVPNANYVWDFGDGTGASGPSVVHSYSKGGTYQVKLTVTDRGGNVQTLVQTISVLGFNGLPVPPSNPPTGVPSNTGSAPGGLKVTMQLLPQSLSKMLKSGIAVQVTSNEVADGIARVLITRAQAKRLHIKGTVMRLGVVIGTGTLSSVKDGTVKLHFRLSHKTAAKLKKAHRVSLTLSLSLVGPAGDHLVIDAAGRY
jgi:PKD domain